MSRTRNKPTPEQQAELDRLRAEVEHAERKGNMDTAHHEMLQRLEAELGLIPARKIEVQNKDEVNDGKSNI